MERSRLRITFALKERQIRDNSACQNRHNYLRPLRASVTSALHWRIRLAISTYRRRHSHKPNRERKGCVLRNYRQGSYLHPSG